MHAYLGRLMHLFQIPHHESLQVAQCWREVALVWSVGFILILPGREPLPHLRHLFLSGAETTDSVGDGREGYVSYCIHHLLVVRHLELVVVVSENKLVKMQQE